jgi:hypothetical protein
MDVFALIAVICCKIREMEEKSKEAHVYAAGWHQVIVTKAQFPITNSGFLDLFA